jgi:hypothetical protein
MIKAWIALERSKVGYIVYLVATDERSSDTEYEEGA